MFFIQDAMKFADLIPAVKPEPHHGMPQAASAHDTFWDFASLMPESTHVLTWAMSDRAIPRSLRMMEGFGVHGFRLVNAAGESRFVARLRRLRAELARRRLPAPGRPHGFRVVRAALGLPAAAALGAAVAALRGGGAVPQVVSPQLGIWRTDDGAPDPGIVVADDRGGLDRFIEAMARHRHFERESDPPAV